MSETGKAVFLSYASQDAEAARRICESLRSGGVEVWFDADGGLEHGDEWDAKIRRQIKECVFFVPVISANTQARLEGYFRIEWDLAAERVRGVAAGVPFILPVVIDDTREPDALVPDRFRKVQWTRLPGGVVPPDVQQRLLKLWSHRVGVLAHDAGRARSPGYAPPVSAALAPGETRAPGLGDPADGATNFGGRRLAAIVFTDAVGYSARMQADEASTLAMVQSDFERMRRLCGQHGGQVLKSTGDGLLLCFDSVADAVTCALAIQAGFAGRGGGVLEHRIGVHLGDVYHQSGDVAGDGVNLAARLQTAAQPGTICVSDAVFAAVRGKVAMESVALAPLVLKNIAQPLPAHLIAPIGTRLAAGARARGVRGRRKWVLAAAGVAALALAAAFFFRRTEKPTVSAPTPALTTVANRAAPTAEFPRDPDLKRVYKLLYNVVDGIAEDFALMDDLVKPLLAARPNDPEVVTVAAGLAQEFVTRGFDASPVRRAQAQKLTERALQLAPDNPEALATLGAYLYSTRTQLGRAEELLRRAIELNPKEPRFYCFLYHVLTASKKPAAEIDAFGVRMAALFPDYAMVPYMIAGHYTDISNFAAAEEWFDKSLAIAPVPSAITSKAQIMLEVHGDVEEMKRWLERMPDRQRTNARMANTYAVLATVTGQTAPARRLLESIGDTWLADGTYIFPKALLGGELDQIDGNNDVARLQFEAALKEIRSKQAADPTDLRWIRAELWVQLGLGHRDEARAALRLNLQRRPTPYRWNMNFTWWTSALRACLLLDELPQAITLLKEACVEPTGRLLLRNLFRVDPKMAPFRDDPEISTLLAEPKKETAALPAPATAAEKSVAVLAFANLSDDKDNEYFSDGISEELLNVLAKVPKLKVAARTSSFYFKGRNEPIPEVAQKLGVAYVVEGSVRKGGDKVRITAQLIKAADGFHVWSETYDRDLKDIFAVQDEIAKNILTAVKGSLMGETELPHATTTKIEAYTLYLQAQGALAKRGDAKLREAIRLFEAALAVDANYVPALVGLGQARALVPLYANLSGAKARAMIDGAMTAATRAIELDAGNPGAHAVIGWLLVQYEWKWAEGEAAVRRALELAPNDAWIWNSLGDHYRFIGEFAKGIAAKQRAWELDPLSPNSQWDLGYAHLVAGNFDQALHWSEVSVGLSPHNLDSYSPGIMAACLSGRTELMRKLVTAARQNVHENEGLLLLLEARTAIQEKKSDEARRLLTKATPLAETGDTTPAFIGYLYLLLGDADQAATWLQRAYEERDSTIVWNELIDLDVIAANPKTRPILDRPGIKELYELRHRNARAVGKKL